LTRRRVRSLRSYISRVEHTLVHRGAGQLCRIAKHCGDQFEILELRGGGTRGTHRDLCRATWCRPREKTWNQKNHRIQAEDKEKKREKASRNSNGENSVMWEADWPTFNHFHFSTFSPPDKTPSCFNLKFSASICPRPGALITMDVVAAVSGYVSKMVTAGESASGSSSTKMKILLLDSETVRDALS
jgi:hypothetical protein